MENVSWPRFLHNCTYLDRSHASQSKQLLENCRHIRASEQMQDALSPHVLTTSQCFRILSQCILQRADRVSRQLRITLVEVALLCPQPAHKDHARCFSTTKYLGCVERMLTAVSIRSIGVAVSLLLAHCKIVRQTLANVYWT